MRQKNCESVKLCITSSTICWVWWLMPLIQAPGKQSGRECLCEFQSSLHRKLQDSQSYIERPCPTNNNKNKNLYGLERWFSGQEHWLLFTGPEFSSQHLFTTIYNLSFRGSNTLFCCLRALHAYAHITKP